MDFGPNPAGAAEKVVGSADDCDPNPAGAAAAAELKAETKPDVPDGGGNPVLPVDAASGAGAVGNPVPVWLVLGNPAGAA